MSHMTDQPPPNTPADSRKRNRSEVSPVVYSSVKMPKQSQVLPQDTPAWAKVLFEHISTKIDDTKEELSDKIEQLKTQVSEDHKKYKN